MTRRTGLVASAIAIFAVLSLFHRLSPLSLDDYGFILRVHALSDIITESLEQYFTWDGRIGGYICTLAVIFLPEAAAHIILPLLQTGFVCLMAMHVLGRDWKERLQGKTLLAIAALLWLSLPDFGQVLFWRSGTPYVFIAGLFLILLWPYRRFAQWGEYPPRSFVACIPLALFCGLADFHNSVAAALVAATLAALGVYQSKKPRILPFIPPLMLLLGFGIIYTAPGNALRIAVMYPDFFEHSRLAGIVAHLRGQGNIQIHYLWEYTLMALCAFFLYRCRTGTAPAGAEPANASTGAGAGTGVTSGASAGADASAGAGAGQFSSPLVMVVAFFLLSQAVQMVFMFSPSPENRAYTSSVIFMILAALILYDHTRQTLAARGRSPLPLRLYWLAAGCVCLVGFGLTLPIYLETKAYTDEIAAKAAAAPGGDLSVPPSPYRAGYRLFYGRQCGIQPSAEDWPNKKFAEYHKLASIRLHPQTFSLSSAPHGITAPAHIPGQIPGQAPGQAPGQIPTGEIPQEIRVGALEGLFDGKVADETLTFAYTPAKELASYPFYLAFPAVPASYLQKWATPLLENLPQTTAFFPYALAAVYDRVDPELSPPAPARAGTGTGTGTESGGGTQPEVLHGHAVLKYPDRARRGYIVHYRPGTRDLVGLVRLSAR